MAGAISQWGHAMFFGGRDSEGRSNPIAGLAMALLAPIAASLIQMAISRSREFEADRGGAEISGDPHALADARQDRCLRAGHSDAGGRRTSSHCADDDHEPPLWWRNCQPVQHTRRPRSVSRACGRWPMNLRVHPTITNTTGTTKERKSRFICTHRPRSRKSRCKIFLAIWRKALMLGRIAETAHHLPNETQT